MFKWLLTFTGEFSVTPEITLSHFLRPIPPPLTVATVDIPLPSVGQADLPLCVIRSHRWVPTPSKHLHAYPGRQYTYSAFFPRQTLVLFPCS